MPHPTEDVAVRHPLTDQFVALDRAINYDDGDALVTAYPWAFITRTGGPAGSSVEDGHVTAVVVPRVTQSAAKKAVGRRK